MTPVQYKQVSPEIQAELRTNGLLAAPGERWEHPAGSFHLQALPSAFNAKQRRRGTHPITVRAHRTITNQNEEIN